MQAMGLTIYYRFVLDGGKNPFDLLERLRQKAMDLPFAEVSSKVYHMEGQAADWQAYEKESPFVWPLIQSVGFVDYVDYEGSGRKYSICIPPKEVYFFRTWPGKGSEEANFGLAKYPSTVTFHGKRLRTNLGNNWRWSSFCKTQYASKVSPEHFLKCHYSVCLLLREAEKLGILAGVDDEGNFWGNWDFDELAKEVSEWNAMIGDVVKRLKAEFGERVISVFDN